MTPGNYGQPEPPPANQSGTWPPPVNQGGTWPPPPASPFGVWPPAPEAATVAVPFKAVQRRVSGKEYRKAHHSDFRVGSVQVGGGGLLISGKAVIRAEIRYPIFVVALIVARFIGLIAYAVMEYAFRRDAAHQVAWDAVRVVQLAPQKQQACVVYDAPNYKGIVKTFSLAFSLDAASFPAFAQQVQQAVPGRLMEGNLKNAISVRVWIRLIVLLLFVAIAVVTALTGHH